MGHVAAAASTFEHNLNKIPPLDLIGSWMAVSAAYHLSVSVSSVLTQFISFLNPNLPPFDQALYKAIPAFITEH